MQAYLVLEDGSVFTGKKICAFKETVYVLVINTSMTGYLEFLSVPTYSGLGVLMTYPMVVNYGVNPGDFESRRPCPGALIINEICSTPSNFRSKQPLEAILLEFDIPCIGNIDTRAVVKKIRGKSLVRAILTDDISDLESIAEKLAAYESRLPKTFYEKTQPQTFGQENLGPDVAVFDCGIKNSQIKALVDRDCRVTVYPTLTPAQTLAAGGHQGLMIGGGPELLLEDEGLMKEISALLALNLPTFAVGVGQLLTAKALGGGIEKIKMGHRGSNYPVRFLEKDRTYVTSQNHALTPVPGKLPVGARVLCENINDKSVEGLVYSDRPLFSVQFYPDVKKGKHTTAFLFDRFIEMVKGGASS